MTLLSIEEYKKKKAEGTILTVDVREMDEWNEGHIDDAVHIPLKILEFVAEERIPDKETCIVMCCRSGGRASVAADILAKLGYSDIRVLDGGFIAYQENA